MTAQVAAALTWPVLAGAAIGVLVLLIVAGGPVGRVVTITHEGGHMVIGSLTGGRVKDFELSARQEGGGTNYHRLPGWLGDILTTFAGYVTPPLVGLGGAVLLEKGLAWPLLWTAVALLVLAWIKAIDDLTNFVVLILVVFIGYVGLYGEPVLQAAFAAGLVLLLLLGGLRAAVISDIKVGPPNPSDAEILARNTLIPAVLWKAAYVTVAFLCLWKGIQVLVS
jgi:Peptidase M50B-like